MNVLLDTVTFLHATMHPARLSKTARSMILDPDNDLYLSTVSSLEIAIKYALKKITLSDDPTRFVPEHRNKLGAEALDLGEESSLHLTRLPALHRDPFDRILICQAIVHGMVLLTPDPVISRYPVRTAW